MGCMNVSNEQTTAAIITLQIVYREFLHAEIAIGSKGIPQMGFARNDVTKLHTHSSFLYTLFNFACTNHFCKPVGCIASKNSLL